MSSSKANPRDLAAGHTKSLLDQISRIAHEARQEAPEWFHLALVEHVKAFVGPELKKLESRLEKKLETHIEKKLESVLENKVESLRTLHKEQSDAKIDEARGDLEMPAYQMRDELPALHFAAKEDPIKARDGTIKVLEAQIEDRDEMIKARDEKIKILEAQITVLERAVHGIKEAGVRCETKESLASL